MKKHVCNTHKLSILFFIALCFLMSSPCFAADFYVDSVNGTDSGDGSINAPWKTIGTALKHARNSDTVYVKAGTYNESVNLAMIPLREISLIGIPEDGKNPVIHSNSETSDAIFLVNFQGTISNLDITGAEKAHGINCIARQGKNLGKITHCNIYGNDIGVHVTTAGPEDANCTPVIQDNRIFSNTTRGIGIMGWSTPEVRNNFIYENGSGKEGNGGIGTRDFSRPIIAGNVIYNNNHSGIGVRDNAKPSIINNTICKHCSSEVASAGIRFNQNSPDNTVKILNNIIAYNDRGLITPPGHSYSGNDFNDVWNNFNGDFLGFEKGENSISSDPLFVDIENNLFSLQKDSPCINTASSESAPRIDIAGVLRPQGVHPDIGAYEYLTPPPTITITTSGTTITVNWEQVPDADYYILYYAPEDISYIESVNVADQTEFSTELWPGAAFYVAVKAYNEAACSDFSNIELVEIPE